jgi:TrmH family RNA methyltransferase
MIISSQNNSRIKQIRALRQRKGREQTGLAFIEGIRVVAEAAALPDTIETLVVAPERLSSAFAQELVQDQVGNGISCLEVTPEVFGSLSVKEGPQGIGAVIRQRWETLEHITLSGEFCWVALDAVQDPGNLGTILRTCDAVGCGGVILLDQSTDPYDATALRASMGAIFTQRLVKASFADFAAWKYLHGYPVVGTSGDSALDYQSAAYRFPTILLMGSERLGLSSEQQTMCDLVVSLPMVGRADSLNLAVATGVMLYALFGAYRTQK